MLHHPQLTALPDRCSTCAAVLLEQGPLEIAADGTAVATRGRPAPAYQSVRTRAAASFDINLPLGHDTNNGAEVAAARTALLVSSPGHDIELRSDSEYTVNMH